MEADPIQFKREDGVITLTMSVENYDRMLLILGYRLGWASCEKDGRLFWETVRFCNDMNAGNPQYRPYAIPEEYGG